MRLALTSALILAVAIGGVYIGKNWDAADEAKRDLDIVKEIKDATTDDRDTSDIDRRLRELAGR